MMKAALEVKTEVLYREIRAHGVAVLRYRLAYPVIAECDAISDFYRQTAYALRDYSERTAVARAEKFMSSSRTERAGFREMMIRSVPNVVWADNRHVSVLLDFIAADREAIHRMVRTAHTFERDSGRICMPSEFLGRRHTTLSEDFYLSPKGLVFVVNSNGEELSSGKKTRLEQYVREILIEI
ncbi:MAG: hypothetical protein DBY04_00805 [Clostridiales bacterium]|nr:MAG: hypothetical protein DBY04_00805 [Clostridiales bacterium]